MKKLALLFAVVSAFTACKEEERGDIKTPKGIIIEAVRALTKEDSKKFNKFLDGAAAQKYGSSEMQGSLLESLGDVRKLKLSSERVVSQDKTEFTTVTTSEIDVLKSNRVTYTVTTQCSEIKKTTQVCHSDPSDYYPPTDNDDTYTPPVYTPPVYNPPVYNPPTYDPPLYNPPVQDNSRPPRYDGRNDDHSSNSNSGGYITPGPSSSSSSSPVDRNPPPRYDGRNDDHSSNNSGSSSGGYITPGPSSSSSSSSSGGYITPGPSSSSSSSSSQSGSNGSHEGEHKPGSQDPNRPPRVFMGWSANNCYQTPTGEIEVSCKIIDLQ